MVVELESLLISDVIDDEVSMFDEAKKIRVVVVYIKDDSSYSAKLLLLGEE